MRKRRFLPFLLIAVLLAAALPAYAGSSGKSKKPERTEPATACAKIEGSDLGTDGIVLHVDGADVTITGWTTKPGEPGEYIGFSYSSDASATALTVKAGTHRHQTTGQYGDFEVPRTGKKLHAISNIEACAVSFDDIVS